MPPTEPPILIIDPTEPTVPPIVIVDPTQAPVVPECMPSAKGDKNAFPYPSFSYTNCKTTVHGIRVDGKDFKTYDKTVEAACQELGADYHAFKMDDLAVIEVCFPLYIIL